jgi:uncharacterized phage-associated protein
MVHSETFSDVVLAIANHPAVSQLGKTKLWKLIYFIEAEMLKKHGRTLTGSEFIRYEHGPVPSRGEKILKSMEKAQTIKISQDSCGPHLMLRVISLAESKPMLDENFSDIIDHVCLKYGSMTASTISELSHREPAWLSAEKNQKMDPVLIAYGCEEDPEGI